MFMLLTYGLAFAQDDEEGPAPPPDWEPEPGETVINHFLIPAIIFAVLLAFYFFKKSSQRKAPETSLLKEQL